MKLESRENPTLTTHMAKMFDAASMSTKPECNCSETSWSLHVWQTGDQCMHQRVELDTKNWNWAKQHHCSRCHMTRNEQQFHEKPMTTTHTAKWPGSVLFSEGFTKTVGTSDFAVQSWVLGARFPMACVQCPHLKSVASTMAHCGCWTWSSQKSEDTFDTPQHVAAVCGFFRIVLMMCCHHHQRSFAWHTLIAVTHLITLIWNLQFQPKTPTLNLQTQQKLQLCGHANFVSGTGMTVEGVWGWWWLNKSHLHSNCCTHLFRRTPSGVPSIVRRAPITQLEGHRCKVSKRQWIWVSCVCWNVTVWNILEWHEKTFVPKLMPWGGDVIKSRALPPVIFIPSQSLAFNTGWTCLQNTWLKGSSMPSALAIIPICRVSSWPTRPTFVDSGPPERFLSASSRTANSWRSTFTRTTRSASRMMSTKLERCRQPCSSMHFQQENAKAKEQANPATERCGKVEASCHWHIGKFKWKSGLWTRCLRQHSKIWFVWFECSNGPWHFGAIRPVLCARLIWDGSWKRAPLINQTGQTE